MRKKGTGYFDLKCERCKKDFKQVGTHFRRQQKKAKMRGLNGEALLFCSIKCQSLYRQEVYFREREITKKRIPLRFWSFVNKAPGQGPDGDCWEWSGARGPKNYGIFSENVGPWKTKAWIASRALFELILKVSIPSGTYVCHRCNNPPCVNPKHLYFGSAQDNSDDKVLSRRHSFGETSKQAKLRDKDVLSIRKCHMDNPLYTCNQIKQHLKLNISASSIYGIITNRTWKHLL